MQDQVGLGDTPYLLTPWNRFSLEKLTGFQLVKKSWAITLLNYFLEVSPSKLDRDVSYPDGWLCGISQPPDLYRNNSSNFATIAYLHNLSSSTLTTATTRPYIPSSRWSDNSIAKINNKKHILQLTAGENYFRRLTRDNIKLDVMR